MKILKLENIEVAFIGISPVVTFLIMLLLNNNSVAYWLISTIWILINSVILFKGTTPINCYIFIISLWTMLIPFIGVLA